MSTSHRRQWVSVAAAVVTAAMFSSLPGWGQVRPAVGPGNTPTDAQPDKDSPAGVTVPESPGATEKLQKGDAKTDGKQWKAAAEFYTDAVLQYAGRVAPPANAAARVKFHFDGISKTVQERLAKWPADGLKVYDSMYDKTAADQLAAAGPQDIGTVQAVFWTYFVTPAGKQAGIRMVDNYIESGDYAAAAWVANRLLKLHPSLGGDWGMVAYRAVTANHYAGDDVAANDALSKLKAKPEETGTIAGKDVRLADAADAVMAATAPTVVADPADSDTWPSYGGIGSHGGLAPTSAQPGANLSVVRLDQPDLVVPQQGGRTAGVQVDNNSLLGMQAMGVMPAVDGGSLFFQDGRSIYAVDVDSGRPLPGWLTTYPGNRNGRFHINVNGRARSELLTITVSTSKVLAIMGQPDRQLSGPYGYQFGTDGNIVSQVKLVCLDRNNGREQWTKLPNDLPESAGIIRNGSFNGTPLVVPARLAGKSGPDDAAPPEDSVLVCVRGGKDNQFDDCYVVCLSSKTGEFRWSTYIGSAARNMEYGYGGDVLGQDPSQLALADGRVMVMSNLGTVCALDPADGRLIWLSGYSRDNQQQAYGRFRRGPVMNDDSNDQLTANQYPWARNPIIVANGKVFAQPTDTNTLFVFDAETGDQLKKIPTVGFEAKIADSGKTVSEPKLPANMLLGVRGDLVYLSSVRSVFGINWKNYDPAHAKVAVEVARMNLAGTVDSSSDQPNILCGRGFLTTNALFISSNKKIYQLDPDKLTVTATYPSQGEFEKQQVRQVTPGIATPVSQQKPVCTEPGPGNIIVTAQSIIVAGQKRVDTYAELPLVRTKYDTLIKNDPTDPDLHIRYAVVLYTAGVTDEALAEIDKAIDLAGGRGGMRPGPSRQRIYASVLDFANRSAGDAKSRADAESNGTAQKGKDQANAAATAEFAAQLFDRVTDAAFAPIERATARLNRAAFEHNRRGYAAEINLCQEVLTDPEQRDVLWQENATGGQSAEEMIGVVLAFKSPLADAYAPIEAKAKTARDDAGDDPDKLLAVAALYPNSEAAKLARKTAVETFETTKQIPRAIEILKQVYAKAAGSHEIQADTLTRIAGDYLAMPDGIGPAIDRLAWARRIDSSSGRLSRDLNFPDGTSVPKGTLYRDALVKLRGMQNETALAALPDFRLPPNPDGHAPGPFKPGPAPVIADVGSLIHPLPAYPCHDQVLTWSTAGLRIYPVGQTTPLATLADVKEPPTAAARVKDKWIVWTPTTIVRFNADDGQVDWSFKISSLPDIPVTAGTAFEDSGNGGESVNDVMQQRQFNQQIQVNQQAVIINGQLRMRRGRVLNVGGVPGTGMPAATPVPNGSEQILSVDVAGDKLVGFTTKGRTFAVTAPDGKLAWQARPSDKAPDQAGANMGFAFSRFDDQTGSVVVVFDAGNGRIIGRRHFGADGTMFQLMNVTLSEEGTMAITLAAKAEIRNLYDGMKVESVDITATNRRDNENFMGLNQNQQLVAAAGRVVALYNGGQQFRVYDVAMKDATDPLSTGGSMNAAWLQVVGNQVFVLQSSAFAHYNLIDATDNEIVKPSNEPTVERARALFVSRKNVVVLSDLVDKGPVGSPQSRLFIYATDGNRLESHPSVNADPTTGITEWIAVNGGFYYQTTDQQLHFLESLKVDSPTTAPTTLPAAN